MIKVRVYEVARELGLDNRELVSKIASLGIQVRNHMSALEPAEVERIKRALDKDKQANVVEERIRPTVVRRRAVGGQAPAAGRHDDIAGPATASPYEEAHEEEAPPPRVAPAARAPEAPAPVV